jgi:ABC-type transport system involved in multi-copper enzyme maturation permease subunit
MVGRMRVIEYMGDPGTLAFTCMYWCQIWFAFVMSLLVAAPAVSDDVRTGAFQFYFARPVTGAQYLVGKLVPVALLAMAVAGVPGLLLAFLRLALSSTGGEALSQLSLVLQAIVYTPIYAAVLSLPPIALSALGRRGGTIQGLWAASFFLPWVFGESVAAVSDVDYVALISLPTNLRLVGQYIFGVEPSYALPWYLPAGVLALVLAASAGIVLRRLARVEVFA